jgi:hypothetical protein
MCKLLKRHYLADTYTLLKNSQNIYYCQYINTIRVDIYNMMVNAIIILILGKFKLCQNYAEYLYKNVNIHTSINTPI